MESINTVCENTLNPLPADSFSKYKTKVIPNKVCIIRLYTIKYCIFRVNRLIFSRNFTSMALTILCFCNVWTEKKNVYRKTGNGIAFAGKQRYVDISCQNSVFNQQYSIT